MAERSARPRHLEVSTANTAFQRIDVLRRNRNKRHRYGEFVVEGVRAINGALAGGWTVRSFAYPRDRQLSQWATDILDAIPRVISRVFHGKTPETPL